ncbi:DUF1294 domain-containing protein [Microbulbifer aestuariivivens]|uniref:DUF1294 domain-containing protein n=1 Tax=Microbulbifer aestuariivivens TaxID=1908308 RepID=UPI0031ECDA48
MTTRTPSRPQRQRRFALALVVGFFAGLTAAQAAGLLPWSIVCYYLALSLVAWLFYAADKRAAVVGLRRTPERTLHWLSLLGGWPGALLAQSYLRHKSSKTAFRLAYWLSVCLNLGALGYAVAAGGIERLYPLDDWLLGMSHGIASGVSAALR